LFMHGVTMKIFETNFLYAVNEHAYRLLRAKMN
jgi:hypothetical protein